MSALPELLVAALALVSLWVAAESAIDLHGPLADDQTPLDDIILYSLV